MTLKERIAAFERVGGFIDRHFNGAVLPAERPLHEGLDALIITAGTYNNWFTLNNVNEAIKGVGSWLHEGPLNDLMQGRETVSPKTVALVCAGNIPMVGFHDVMCVLLSGHLLLIKLSDDDHILIPFFLRLLVHFEPRFEESIRFSDGKISGFDAIIATGSNNTASHFEYYFKKYPNIIRKSRSSVAVLTGKETTEDLKELGKDIFLYFGLGCRNVSQILVPKDYSFNQLFESIVDYGDVVNNKKYGNNYDYHRALFLLESEKFLDNNFLMVKESEKIHSPVGVLHYYRYADNSEVRDYLEKHRDDIQCVVGAGHTPFGYSQYPVITEFADGKDTVEFLVTL